MLQQIKFFIRDQLGLHPAAVQVATGLVAHVTLNAVLQKSPFSAWGLLAPVVLGVALESYEIWIKYKLSGLFAPGNDPIIVILGRHGLDVAKMLAAPILLVAIGAIAKH